MTLATTTTIYKDDVSVIPAADLNSWRTNIEMAIDGCAGGSYAPALAPSISGAGLGTAIVRTLVSVPIGGHWDESLGAEVTDVDGQTLTLAQGQFREFTTPTAQRDHEISETGAVPGSWICFQRPATGNFAIILHRPSSAAAIVTLPNLTWASATIYFDNAGLWRLLDTSFGVAGAEA